MTLDAWRASLIYHYAWFGITGSGIILLSMLVTALGYRGRKGESYSIFNHYVSELGERGVSQLANIFNVGLILGGICLIPFVVGLGMALANTWGKFALGAGIIAALSSIAVGVFPLNTMRKHYVAAGLYFRSGWLTTLLFTVAIFVQNPEFEIVPKMTNLAGISAFLFYAIFLLYSDIAWIKSGMPDGNEIPDPPAEMSAFSRIPFLEWLVILTTMVWFIVISLTRL